MGGMGVYCKRLLQKFSNHVNMLVAAMGLVESTKTELGWKEVA